MIAHPLIFSLVAGGSFLGNVGLGRLRARARKFSAPWFLWIHLSVPVIIALRLHYGLRPTPLVIPALILCAVTGQVIGARLPALLLAAFSAGQ